MFVFSWPQRLPRASAGEAGDSDFVVLHAGLDENGKRLAGRSDLGQLSCLGHFGPLSWELNNVSLVAAIQILQRKIDSLCKENLRTIRSLCAEFAYFGADWNQLIYKSRRRGNFYTKGLNMMNTNVKELKIEQASSQEISSGIFIQEIVRNLNEARKYGEMHTDPELLYFISMALQCANEKRLLSMYESN
jgi:hypothetical protein